MNRTQVVVLGFSLAVVEWMWVLGRGLSFALLDALCFFSPFVFLVALFLPVDVV